MSLHELILPRITVSIFLAVLGVGMRVAPGESAQTRVPAIPVELRPDRTGGSSAPSASGWLRYR